MHLPSFRFLRYALIAPTVSLIFLAICFSVPAPAELVNPHSVPGGTVLLAMLDVNAVALLALVIFVPCVRSGFAASPGTPNQCQHHLGCDWKWGAHWHWSLASGGDQNIALAKPISMRMIRWRVLLVRTLMIGVPLTFVGAAFTWDALHPESLLPFIAIVPAIVLKYMDAVPPAIFPLVFVALQFAYYFAIVSIFYCLRSRHLGSGWPKDGSRDG